MLVEDSCRRDLTLGKDKLLAIAGVAAQMHHMYGGLYVAGLWSDTIISDLTWKRDDTPGLTSYSKPVGSLDVPTWSWACTSCPIRSNTIHLFDFDARLLECGIRPKFKNAPFGDIEGRSLVLSAKMVKVERSLRFDDWSCSIVLDKESCDQEIPYPKDHSQLLKLLDREREERWCMLLGHRKLSKFEKMPRRPVGLILAKSKDCFERVGLFEGEWTGPNPASGKANFTLQFALVSTSTSPDEDTKMIAQDVAISILNYAEPHES
ncbi:uncharacterized protein LY89DRAFT_762181 [Mollisia scopiformis]|uniref:Uncharacterized protein n=1 Tax=Mollisia scopiformis TaxID=149040 RepID=A0A194XPY9_MOLSC|nr:uncharacterized protein LY89DRAFT_762181 [Mollisia scopiformis]KUJ22226.1 hypothetical protein LY89DRAFT_762181 [Mollisia scopiformis]